MDKHIANNTPSFDEIVEIEKAGFHKARNDGAVYEFGGYIVNTGYLSKAAGDAVEQYLKRLGVE